MKTTKRILAFVLCFVMLVGLMPAITLNADAATGEVIDAAIFCSDVHGSSSVVSSVFSTIKTADSTFDPTTAAFVGDTDMATSTVTQAAQGVYSDIACYYAYGSHDSGYVTDTTGVLYNGTNYAIYAISQSNMESYSNAQTASASFASDIAAVDATKPLFIISHMPLHARRSDNDGAGLWCDAINAQAGSRDIVFFWAHNHTGETSTDTAAYYLAKGSSITVEDDSSDSGNSSSTSSKTLAFTYMNAGYIGKDGGRGGVVTTVKIYSDALVFQDYTSSGAFTDEDYSHNVEVARTASSTDSGNGGSTDTTDPTEGTTAPTEGEDDTDSSVSNGVHVEGTDTTTNAYVYTSTAASGSAYILVSNGYALYNNGGSISATAVTVTDNVVTVNDSSVDVADLLWTINDSGDLTNDGYFLLRASGANATKLTIGTSDTGDVYSNWTYSSDTLTVTGGSGGNTTYYAYYDTDNSAFYTYPSSSQELKFYGLSEVTTNTSGTYYLDAKDVTTHSALSDTTSVTLTKVITFVADGSTTSTTVTDLDGTYTYAINDNTSGVIASVSEDGVVTINPNVTGTATVDVTYTWTVDGTEYSMTDTATIKVTEVVDQGVVEGYTSTTTGSTTKTVYKLVSGITEADNYLIVDSNSATTSANLLTASSSGVTNTSGVTVVQGTDADGNTIYYIEDPAAATIWAATANGSGYRLQNTSLSRYLRVRSSELTTTGESKNASTMIGSNNTLYRSSDNYYVYYSDSDSSWARSDSSQTVYIYKEETIQVSSTVETAGTVSLEAGDPITTVVNGETDLTLDPTILFAGKNATSTFEALGGTYTVEFVSGDQIISSTDGKTVTLNGTIGTATVRVKYTWTVNGTSYAVWDTTTITTKEPYYDIQLHEAVINYTAVTGEFDATATYFILNADGEYEKVEIEAFEDGVTYYTVSATPSAEPIEDTIVLKGKNAGDTYYVWAVVKLYDGTDADGTDQGDVPDSRILWTSSNTNIATVDASTGEITFTGKEYGKFTVTVYYLDEDGKVICEDAVEISVTQTQYVVPEDDTDDDFPKYPDEGAIRYDKTATAVGNFSETGMAKVELSMTGVPYTTGSEIDIVLMLDMTGSMETGTLTITNADGSTSTKTYKQATLDAACAFVESVMTNEDGSLNGNRIGIYVFHVETSSSGSSGKPGEGGSDREGTVDQIWPLDGTTMAKITSLDVLDAIIGDSGYIQNATSESGGTHYDVSLQKCYTILNESDSGNKEFCVFMSDGVPTSYAPLESDGTVGDSVEPSSSSWWDSNDARNDSYQYEYYSTKMKAMGVTVYSVGLGAGDFADMLLNDISGPAYETANDTGSAMSKEDSYFYSISSSGSVSDLESAFTSIATSVKQAATDVVVADQITPQYTMVFDAPNTDVDGADGSQEYYIEVNEWTLDPVYDEDGEIEDYIRDTATSKLKLYLQWSDDGSTVTALDGNNDKAEFAAPTFNDTAIGTMFYWTTAVDTTSGVSVTVDGTTYYFVPNGISNTEDDFDETVWFNMASGAYASGTLTTEDVVTENTDGTTSTTTSTTCKNLIIATPLFVYNASTKMIYWTAEKLSSTELALSYFVYLDKSGGWVGAEDETDPGTYPTNVGATITYTNYQDHRCQQEFPIPQMTWKGAQVTYVFYLVNEYGQPVSRSGLRIPFSEAVYVTKEYTHSVVWNEEGGVTALNAAELAEGLVPDVYTLYDPDAYYEINVYMTTGEDTGYDHFIIEGGTAADIASSVNSNLNKSLTADDVSIATTKVFNTKADYEHRYSAYGAYSNVAGTYKSDSTQGGSGTEYTVSAANENLITDFDYCNTTVAFAVVWSPSLAPDTVVVDYGLDVVIDVTTNDSMASGVVGVRSDIPTISGSDVLINSGNYTPAKAQSTEVKIGDVVVGTATVENLTSVRFSMDKTNGMQLSESVVFYYESEVNYYTYDANDNKNLTTTGMYSSVTIIPATTIYYEDEYITLTTYTKQENGTYLESKGWTVNSTNASATQAQDRPGVEKIVSSPDANNAYGYDAAYKTMSTYSMGSAAQITVTPDVEGWADFEFYGTGFDVIATTSNTTGAIIVEVYELDENGNYDINNPIKSLTVDTYYGFKYENDQWVAVDSNDPNVLYQVPVMKIEGLDYGKYHASILAFYGDLFDHTGDEQYEFCLDAIRIYDPTGNQDDVANKAYVADGEGWPSYKEVRNYVIGQSTYEELGEGTVEGIVFIDGKGNTNQVADYASYGPNNELYLAHGQSIAFDLNVTATAGEVAKIQLALKTVGGSASVKVYAPDGTTALETAISTATDMYYDITGLNGKTVVITNTGDSGILSITNVKVTYTEAQPAETAPVMMFSVRRSSVDAALATMNVEEEETVPETTVPEETVPETTVPEETVPETTVPEETAPETTVPEETEPETTIPEETEPSTEEQVQEVIEKVSEIIKQIFGWLFG